MAHARIVLRGLWDPTQASHDAKDYLNSQSMCKNCLWAISMGFGTFVYLLLGSRLRPPKSLCPFPTLGPNTEIL